MAPRQHIDDILRQWKFEPHGVSARVVKGADGREVLQMRVDMGLLQMEATGRPDGNWPEGAETYYDYLVGTSLNRGDSFVMSEDQCLEADREFVQYYHRRVCWLQLSKFERAVDDADHTLALMDFCRGHSPDEDWTMSHEQYRPFVLFHRTQAAALAELYEGGGPEPAVQQINEGLDRLRAFFSQFDLEEHFEDHELVGRLIELREELREKFEVGRTLQEQLNDAVAAEKYELAAKLRDELARRETRAR